MIGLAKDAQFFQRGQDNSTIRVSQHHDESCAEPFRGELDAADLRGSHDVSGNTDHEQIPKALIEDDLRWHSRIGASEDNGERFLARCQLAATRLARKGT